MFDKQYKIELTDKIFYSRLAKSIIAIFLCIIGLCATTWMRFAYSISDVGNAVYLSKTCLIYAKVYDAKTDELIATVDIDDSATVECEGLYRIDVSLPKDSFSGHLLISSDDDNYRSEYLVKHDEQEPKAVSFFVNVSEPRYITFRARLGIYSGECHVYNGETLTIEKHT